MKERFKQYLVMHGYKEKTPSGKPSTAYDYVMRINKVCEWERTDWEGLSGMIGRVIPQYDKGGIKENLGNKSHRAVINALLRFEEFLNETV